LQSPAWQGCLLEWLDSLSVATSEKCILFIHLSAVSKPRIMIYS
jgi:hypothetical protein